MNKKIVGGVVGVLVLFVFLFVIGVFDTAPSEDATRAEITGNSFDVPLQQVTQEYDTSVPINSEISSFEFEGFGPGKSHLGTFEEMNGELYIRDGDLVGFEGTIQTASVETGIGGLNDHLMSNDFFNAVKYPEITFVSHTLDDDVLYGYLTFLGVTEEVSFPVEITPESISADFVLDTVPFGLDNPKANNEVRIAFTFAK